MREEVEHKYDLFISYANADLAWVQGYLLDALADAGITYLTEAAFKLGMPRIQGFEDAIRESKCCLLILSSAYLRDETIKSVDLLAQS